MVKVRVKRLRKYAKLPEYAYRGDAGMDLFSAENYNLKPGERRIINTGIAMSFPRGYAALIWDKSGISSEHGISTMAGVIDSGYRGEIGVVLHNTSDEHYKIHRGDKVAQTLIQKVESCDIIEVEKLENSDRGEKGFGSSGSR